MQNVGHPGAICGASTAFAPGIDPAQIVQSVASAKDARALPVNTVVGDQEGGLSFSDTVAAALEARSLAGWQEFRDGTGDLWTVIVLNRQ